MTAENPDFEVHPTKPGTFEDLAMAMDIASGRSDVGTSFDPLFAEELRELGATEDGQKTIKFFRIITGIDE